MGLNTRSNPSVRILFDFFVYTGIKTRNYPDPALPKQFPPTPGHFPKIFPKAFCPLLESSFPSQIPTQNVQIIDKPPEKQSRAAALTSQNSQTGRDFHAEKIPEEFSRDLIHPQRPNPPSWRGRKQNLGADKGPWHRCRC